MVHKKKHEFICSSSVISTQKKDEILRMHVDCRTSNNIMVKYRHSISSLDNILNGFHRSYMFSKIDFKWINEPYFV